MFYALATLPSPAAMLTEIGSWSSPLFNDLLPFALLGAGFVVAGMLAGFILQFIISGLKQAVGLFRKTREE